MERLLRGCDPARCDGDEAREVVRVDRGRGGRGEARAERNICTGLSRFRPPRRPARTRRGPRPSPSSRDATAAAEISTSARVRVHEKERGTAR